MPLIFGRSFMATVGAIIDIPNKRDSFSNINKMVFYKAASTRSQIRYASCISMVSGEQPKIVPKKEFGDKSEIKEVLDGDPHNDTKKLSGNARVKEKVQKKRVNGDPTMTLIPHMCDENSIEYEVKCKGTSKHFSKVKVILASLGGRKLRDTSKILGCSNGTTCPLKRGAVPGDHLTIEHPKFTWSVRSTQISISTKKIVICAKRSERKGSTQPLTRYCFRNLIRKENKQFKGATAP
uniref:Uncharacterized protein n=1 Tax=Brassica oleracea TaxID=3712 RepID=A0A3P6C4B8_BRAOL|nr:unnamed protein product [Brassica oleracea]